MTSWRIICMEHCGCSTVMPSLHPSSDALTPVYAGSPPPRDGVSLTATGMALTLMVFSIFCLRGILHGLHAWLVSFTGDCGKASSDCEGQRFKSSLSLLMSVSKEKVLHNQTFSCTTQYNLLQILGLFEVILLASSRSGSTVLHCVYWNTPGHYCSCALAFWMQASLAGCSRLPLAGWICQTACVRWC